MHMPLDSCPDGWRRKIPLFFSGRKTHLPLKEGLATCSPQDFRQILTEGWTQSTVCDLAMFKKSLCGGAEAGAGSVHLAIYPISTMEVGGARVAQKC